MTAIAGLFQVDGSPVDRSVLDALAAPMYGDVAHSVETWTDGPVGLACALFRDDPEATAERQPVHDGRLGAVADARLDNRPGLQQQLSGLDRELRATGAAGHVLAAYREWGARSVDRLLGDFALAVWDGRAGSLVLACDPMGSRPLYFHAGKDAFVFASTLEQLLRALPERPEVDEEMVLAYLYRPLLDYPRTTYYRGVEALRGGELLTVTADGIRRETYHRWRELPPDRPVMRGDEPDEFRGLLEDAVRARLRSRRPVGVLLSGGLDSGAVSSVAGSLPDRSDVRAYTHVFDRFPDADERRYAIAVTERYGLPHTLVHGDDAWALSELEPWLPVFDDPLFGAFDPLFYLSLPAAVADGVRVMLTGHGGDMVLMGSATYFAWWLTRGEWRALHEQIKTKRRTGRWGYGYQFAAWAVYPLLPQRVLAAVYRRQRMLGPMEAWMPEDVRRRYVKRRADVVADGPAGWWRNLRSDVDILSGTPHTRYMDRLMRRFGLEVRNPLLDTRVVDFALRTPPDVFFRDGLSRWVVSEGLRDVLPPVVRDRLDKTPVVSLLHYGLRERRSAFVRGLLVDSELVRRGLVRGDRWRDAVDRYLRGDDGIPIWTTLSAELWLRHREGRLPPLE